MYIYQHVLASIECKAEKMTGNPLSKALNDLYKKFDRKSLSNVFISTQVKCNIGDKEDMSYKTQMNLCRQYAAQA